MKGPFALPIHLGIIILAGLLAAFGTAVHRGVPPWGLVVAVAATGAAAVLARALAGLLGLFEFAMVWLAVVLAMTYIRPGGDIIVVPGTTGYVWMLGPVLLVGVVAFLPTRWFADPPPPPEVITDPQPDDSEDGSEPGLLVVDDGSEPHAIARADASRTHPVAPEVAPGPQTLDTETDAELDIEGNDPLSDKNGQLNGRSTA